MTTLATLRTRWAAFFAVFALAWHILIPIGQGIAVANAKDNGLPFPLVICTANGPQTLAAPAGEEQAPEPHAAPHCPVCMAHAAAIGIDDAVEVKAPTPVYAAIFEAPPAATAPVAAPCTASNGTRGPPPAA